MIKVMLSANVNIKNDSKIVELRNKLKSPGLRGELLDDLSKTTVQGLRRRYLEGAAARGGSPRTKSSNEMTFRRRSNRVSEIIIPKRSAYLDSMTPHWVSLKRGRNITKWAMRYYRGRRPNGKLPKFLFVRPDPFVRSGLNLAMQEFDDVAQNVFKRWLR